MSIMKVIKNKFFFISCTFLFSLNIFGFYGRKNILLNYTPSLPVGLYKVIESSPNKFNKGDIVSFNIKNIKEIQKKVPGDFNFLKIIAGIPGDKISIEKNRLYINDKFSSIILEKDSKNNLLPQLTKKEFYIKKDEVFVLGKHPNSFDSRYYGAIKIYNIKNKVKPILVFNKKWEDKNEINNM